MIILNKGLYSTFNTTFLCGVKPPTPEFTAGAYGAHPNPAASGLNAAKTWGSESGSLMQRCTNPINGGLFVVRSPSLVPTFEFSCPEQSSGTPSRASPALLVRKQCDFVTLPNPNGVRGSDSGPCPPVKSATQPCACTQVGFLRKTRVATRVWRCNPSYPRRMVASPTEC